MGTLEYFLDYCRTTRISQRWQSSVDAEVVKRCEYRVAVSFGCLLIVFGQRHQKCKHLFLRDAGEITLAKLGYKTGKNELTGFDDIFFWNWLGGTVGENRRRVKLSWYTSCRLKEL